MNNGENVIFFLKSRDETFSKLNFDFFFFFFFFLIKKEPLSKQKMTLVQI